MKSKQHSIKQNSIYINIVLILFIGLFLGLYIYIYYKNQDHFENENGKIAFLFLTYSNLKRPDIWNRFFDIKDNDITKSQYYNKFTIYNHAKEPEKITDLLLKDKHIPEHIDTCWSCANLVEANILMINQALKDPLNKKFILVSDSCIPLVSFNTFYNEVMKDDKSRINFFYNNNPERYHQIINPPFKDTEFLKHSGSGLVINLNHAKLLSSRIDDLNENWKKVSCSDEHYFGNHLVLLDKDFHLNNNDIKNTFDTWSKDNLNLEHICKNINNENENENNDSICTYKDIGYSSPLVFKKLSNKMIDELRVKHFLFIRKVDGNTDIDINYILS